MRCRRFLSAAVVLLAMSAWPRTGEAQAMDKSAKPAMKDTSGMAKQDAMSKDGMSKDAMSKDGMSKDAMSKDGMSKDAMSKDGMSKDGMSKDGMSKDATSKSKTKSKGTMSGNGTMADPEKKTHP